jgi:hypothetical protein
MFSYSNQIPKLKRFPRIGRKMNADLRGMHRPKKNPPLPQAPIKLIIAHKKDNKHKGKCNLFCHLGFEIARTCKPSKHLNAYPSTLKKSKTLESRYA